MATHLPIELWRLIIRRATYTPDLLSVTWDHHPRDQIWEGWEGGETAVDLGLGTKCAIVQVCREWRDIGVEFLYEAVHLHLYKIAEDPSHLDNLIGDFAASAATAPSGRGNGWWTKRVVCHHFLLSSEYVDKLCSFLDQCHNLETFKAEENHHSIVPPKIQNLIGVLESRFPHSLRRIELNIEQEHPLPDVIPRVFGLTSLTLRVLDGTPNPLDYSVFEHITTLTAHITTYIHSFPPQWNFPALRNLSLRGVASRDIAALTPFVKRHQKTLLHLHIETGWDKNYNLASLLSSAPQLCSLAFDRRDLCILEEANTTHSGLTHLGLTFAEKKVGYIEWNQDSLTKTLGGLFPSLQVIRLLSSIDPIFTSSTWRNVSERCSKHGVRLEDRNGELFHLAVDDRI